MVIIYADYFSVGGTIDKFYPGGKGVRDLEIGPAFAPDYLRRMFGSSIIFSHTGLMRKDSLDMNDYDREMVVLACRSSNKDKILITHGTDTMIDTARSIHSAGLGKNKTIVLTGALQPAVMRDTDAMFHLGLAAGACLGLPYGVWIAVNGVHPWNECRKDEVNGMFVPIQ